MKDKHLLKRLEFLLSIEDLHRGIFDGSPIPIWLKKVKDRHLYMIKLNPAYTQYTGITLRAYRGKEDSEIYGDEQGDDLNENDRKVIDKRAPVQIMELITNPKTGRDEYWCGWKFPHIESGDVTGVWGIALPVPASKMTDELREFLIEFL